MLLKDNLNIRTVHLEGIMDFIINTFRKAYASFVSYTGKYINICSCDLVYVNNDPCTLNTGSHWNFVYIRAPTSGLELVILSVSVCMLPVCIYLVCVWFVFFVLFLLKLSSADTALCTSQLVV